MGTPGANFIQASAQSYQGFLHALFGILLQFINHDFLPDIL
jgi:hypothetical protein